jgi:hypothetical protein
MKRFLLGLACTLMLLGFLVTFAHPALAADAKIDSPCDLNNGKTFLGIPVWYKYIDKGVADGLGGCVPDVQFPGDLWAIGMAVIDGLLRVGGIVAVFFIVLAGIAFMTSQGSPDKAVAARQRIINALIGLIILIFAAGIVQFIGNRIQS